MKLYKHQQDIVNLNPKKWLLAWQTGTGKSLASIVLAENNTPHHVALVICPKSLVDQWHEQTKKRKIHFAVLSKEQFKKQVKQLAGYDTIIIDEGHYFAGQKSQLSKALRWYIKKHNTQNIYVLTATPYLSTPWNIYVLGEILGKQWHYWKFKQKFFVDVNMGGRLVPIVRKGIEKDIAKLVSMLGNTVKMEECVDIPDQVFETEYFDLTKEQEKAIESLDDINFITRWTKTHQICGGSLKSDGYIEDQFFKSEKLDRLIELCKEHPKLVIVCRYNNEVEVISKKLDSLKINNLKITGATKDKHSEIKKANDNDRCIVIANAACSEGYELPTFPIMIFYSYDFSLKNYIQMIGRIQRINNIKKNVYISLIVKGTIDEDVYKSIQSKKDFDIAIYEKETRS